MAIDIDPLDQTPSERQAIESLKRLAKKWPKNGMGFYAGGDTLYVVRDPYADPSNMQILETISGITATGGDF